MSSARRHYFYYSSFRVGWVGGLVGVRVVVLVGNTYTPTYRVHRCGITTICSTTSVYGLGNVVTLAVFIVLSEVRILFFIHVV